MITVPPERARRLTAVLHLPFLNREVNVRVGRAAIAVAAVLGGALVGGTSALGASTPAGGSIDFLASSSATGGGGTIIVTGAIGDHGKTLNIDANGKPDPNGEHVKVTLTEGTFEVDAVPLDAQTNKASPTFSPATCSAALSATGPVTLVDGTGLYKGITGTVSVNISIAFLLPRYTSGKHKGKCNMGNNATPFAASELIHGTGTVQFG